MSFRENGAFLSCGGGFRGSPLGEGVCGRPARGCSQGEASPFPKNKKRTNLSIGSLYTPKRFRTAVAGMKIPSPGPLDDRGVLVGPNIVNRGVL